MFNVVAKYGVKQGMTEDVLGLLAQMAAATRREPGNLSYDFYRGGEDPEQIVILESYHEAEDFDRHRESPHFLDVGVRQIIPRLVYRHVSTYTSEDVPHEVP
ncbi:antibiotic biosynthesis monooxygenase [Arthrobacter sp. FX8]|uniref:putative quinol monooxygenase n=1 Tax=Arthrobacter sp. FX8 TaxID=2997335 RepID=UPI00227AF3E9|nr:antibiotic biosynthesis monooxygenase family protein [Arthrobacter sp. FX8]WAJ34413.1 antibiotic biosynthesis monooxygenase [Arthrobacter sp. FX8]